MLLIEGIPVNCAIHCKVLKSGLSVGQCVIAVFGLRFPVVKILFEMMLDDGFEAAILQIHCCFVAAHNPASPVLLPLLVLPMAGMWFISGFWFAMGKGRKMIFIPVRV